MHRLKLISITFLAAISAYWLYALVAVPLIEPQVRRRNVASDGERPAVAPRGRQQHLTQLAALFPAGAWELDEPKVVETDQGIFLFRDYKPQPNGEMELKPCTLVFFTSGAKRAGGQFAGRPIVMSAPGGALLQFDGASDTLKGEFGRLRGGKLPGDIRIHSAETAPGAGDQIEINTRNVQIDENKISTLHEVDFRYGSSFGSGRDLLIELTGPQTTGRAKQNLGPSIGGVKSLELVNVDKFHLHIPPREPTVSANAQESADTAPAAATASRAIFQGAKETTLEVTCRGSFLFDFAEPSASFADHVDVVRLATDGPSDQLNCQLLTVFFAHSSSLAARPATTDTDAERRPPSRQREAPLAIERIAAEGQPAILRAPSVGATARGDYLEYNLKTRRVLLGPVPESRVGPALPATSQAAFLEHEQSQVTARRIEYEVPEDPKRLGRVWADGPGQMIGRIGRDSQQPLTATWGEKLYVRPYEGNQVISLTSGATVRYGDESQFAARELHVWLYEVTALPPADSPGPARYALLPDRLLAQGDVAFGAAKFSGKTERVEAWFDNEPRSAASGATSNISFSNGQGGEPATNPSSRSEPDATPKMDVSGKTIRVQLTRVGSRTVVKNATVDGNVILGNPVPTGLEASLPSQLKITGHALNISDADTGRTLVRIQGNPARVESRGLTMSGAAIQLQQSENRLWIDGAGQMSIPTPTTLKKRDAREVLFENRPAPQLAEPPSRMTVDWKGRMQFDGTTAHFEESVETRGKQWLANGEQVELLAMGNSLDVRLNQHVDFSHPPTNGEVGISRLTYGGSVLFTTRTMKDGGQIAFDQMQINNLTLEQQPNASQPNLIRGEGPGWLSTVRFGNDPIASPPATRSPPPTSPKPRLAFLFVQFARGLEGNLLAKNIVFLEQVKAVYGPVNRWEDQLQPNPQGLGEDGVLLLCQRLSLAEMPGYLPNQRSLELDALGNATVEGRQFAARGGRISYSQAKDLVVLEGDVRAEAELWKLPRTDQVKPDAIARKIMFWRRENRVEVDGARYVDLSRFGNNAGR